METFTSTEVFSIKDTMIEDAQKSGESLKNIYDNDLPSMQNGSIGAEMVRQMIRRQEK